MTVCPITTLATDIEPTRTCPYCDQQIEDGVATERVGRHELHQYCHEQFNQELEVLHAPA